MFAAWQDSIGVLGKNAPLKRHKKAGQALMRMPVAMALRVKAHQHDALRFMWQCIFTPGEGGCVLAHGMGLGKMLDAVVLMAMFVRKHRQQRLAVKVVYVLKASVKTALLNEMPHFSGEFSYVAPDAGAPAQDAIPVYDFNLEWDHAKKQKGLATIWQQHPVFTRCILPWHERGGILLLLETTTGIKNFGVMAHAHDKSGAGPVESDKGIDVMHALFPLHRSVRFSIPRKKHEDMHGVVVKVHATSEDATNPVQDFFLTVCDPLYGKFLAAPPAVNSKDKYDEAFFTHIIELRIKQSDLMESVETARNTKTRVPRLAFWLV